MSHVLQSTIIDVFKCYMFGHTKICFNNYFLCVTFFWMAESFNLFKCWGKLYFKWMYDDSVADDAGLISSLIFYFETGAIGPAIGSRYMA